MSKIIISNPDDNPLIRHFQGEIDIASAEGKSNEELADLVDAISPFLYKGYTYEETRTVLGKAINFLSRKVIVPLNLSIGEFRYASTNLSINRRNPDVKMDLYGIRYDNAYIARILTIFNSYNDCQLSLDFLNKTTPYIDDIFIMAGGKITNHYFKEVYLRKETIEKKSFYPASPIKIDTRAYVRGNEYIKVIKYNNPKFKALRQLYDVPIRTNTDKTLEHFGITFNISKDELLGKRSSICF